MKKTILLVVYNMVCLLAVSAQITISYDASGNMTRKQIVADLPELSIVGVTQPVVRQLTYSVTPVTATSTYQWTVTGGYVTAGQGSANVTVQWTTDTNGILRVTERNQRRCEGVAATKVISMTAKHQIRLTTGWNFISTYLQPLQDSIRAMTSDIAPQLVSVRSQNASYTPNEPLNTLWRWANGRAYFAKLSAPTTLTVIGKALDVNGLSLAIPANQWYYLGYPLDTVLGIRTALANILTEIVGVKTMTENFNPAETNDVFNTLREMRPGNGYFIRVRTPVTLLYPNVPLRGTREITDNTVGFNPLLPADWQLVTYPSSMVAYGRVTLDDMPVSEADKLGVFVGSECRSQVDVQRLQTETVVSMVVNGTESAPMTFKLWKNGRVYTAGYRPTFVNGAWLQDSLMPLKFYSELHVPELQNVGLKVYPNPMRDFLTIELDLKANLPNLNLKIVNAAGQNCYEIQQLPISMGVHSLRLSRADFPLAAGTYFLQLRDGNQTQSVKFVVQ